MMSSLVILLVTYLSNSGIVFGFEEEIDGYFVGEQQGAKNIFDPQSVSIKTPSLQLAASRQVS